MSRWRHRGSRGRDSRERYVRAKFSLLVHAFEGQGRMKGTLSLEEECLPSALPRRFSGGYRYPRNWGGFWTSQLVEVHVGGVTRCNFLVNILCDSLHQTCLWRLTCAFCLMLACPVLAFSRPVSFKDNASCLTPTPNSPSIIGLRMSIDYIPSRTRSSPV